VLEFEKSNIGWWYNTPLQYDFRVNEELIDVLEKYRTLRMRSGYMHSNNSNLCCKEIVSRDEFLVYKSKEVLLVKNSNLKKSKVELKSN